MWRLLILLYAFTTILNSIGCDNNVGLLETNIESNAVYSTESFSNEISTESSSSESRQSESTVRADELSRYTKENEITSEDDLYGVNERNTVLELSASISFLDNQTLELNLYCEYNNGSPISAYISSNLSIEKMSVDIQDRSYFNLKV